MTAQFFAGAFVGFALALATVGLWVLLGRSEAHQVDVDVNLNITRTDLDEPDDADWWKKDGGQS